MKRILAGALLLSSIAGTPAMAADDDQPIVFTPSSRWVADFADGRCLLNRQFKSGDRPLRLSFMGYSPTGPLTLHLSTTDGFGSTGIEYRFGDRNEFNEPVFSAATETNEFEGMIFRISLLPDLGEPEDNSDQDESPDIAADHHALLDFAEQEAAAASYDSITIRNRKGTYVLKTGNLGDPIKVFDHCLTNLVESWGLDVEAHRTMTRAVTVSNEKKLAEALRPNYPTQALRKGMPALVAIRLFVDETGEPTSCEIQNDMSEDIFAKEACEIFRMKGEYEPALDATGEPMKSFYATTLRYFIP